MFKRNKEERKEGRKEGRKEKKEKERKIKRKKEEEKTKESRLLRDISRSPKKETLHRSTCRGRKCRLKV
jgi:hypothetical protein